jgi:hypothetical protein
MFAVAVAFALIDVLSWEFKWPDTSTALWSIGPYVLLISAAEYLAVAGILGRQRSVAGYLRFTGTWTLVFLPIAIAFGLLFCAPVIGRGAALLLFAGGVAVGFVLMAFLPAWPVAQALSSRFVAPTAVLKATRGFRWGLLGMTLVLGGMNGQHLVPDVREARDLAHALAYAAGEAGISAVSFMYTAAIAASAFTWAARNDDRLNPQSGAPLSPDVDPSRVQPIAEAEE